MIIESLNAIINLPVDLCLMLAAAFWLVSLGWWCLICWWRSLILFSLSSLSSTFSLSFLDPGAELSLITVVFLLQWSRHVTALKLFFFSSDTDPRLGRPREGALRESWCDEGLGRQPDPRTRLRRHLGRCRLGLWYSSEGKGRRSCRLYPHLSSGRGL